MNNQINEIGVPTTTPVYATANREYKSTVFSLLYEDRKALLSLYNGINHSHYTNPDDLEIVTLTNAVYMGMKNDKAFLLDCRLNMYEHQSTRNPNMPLRETLIKAFPTPNLHCEAVISFANSCDPPEESKEALI